MKPLPAPAARTIRITAPSPVDPDTSFLPRASPPSAEAFMSLRALVLLLALSAATTGMVEDAVAAEASAVSVAMPQPPSVSVVKAVTREVVSNVAVTGTLVARETVMVGPDVDGLRIEDLLADEGDTVEAGAVLARLSTDMIEIELARNESQIARSDAAVAQSESQIEEAQAAAIETDAALARSKPLQEKGFVGQDILDQRISAASSAKARLASARQGVAVMQADKALMVAERRELDLRKSKAEVRAPAAGLVLSRSARLGAVVSASGGGLFELARDGLVELDAEVGETLLNSLAEHQPVSVTLAGGRDVIKGEVRLVSPKVDETTRLGHVRIALPRSEKLRVGTFARGVVEVARSRGVVIPQTAVVADAEKAVVQVVRGGTVESRTVTLGISTGSDVEILQGVSDGESVVALAGTFVRDGDAVTPLVIPSEAKG